MVSVWSCRVADQLELVFADADLVPLLVQENYVNHRPDISQGKPDFVSCYQNLCCAFLQRHAALVSSVSKRDTCPSGVKVTSMLLFVIMKRMPQLAEYCRKLPRGW